MSGPSTAILTADPVAILLSAAGIRAAMAIREGYAHSTQLKAQHQAEHAAVIKHQESAAQQGQLAAAQSLALAETEFDQLLALSERIGVAEQIRSRRPADASLQTLQRYNAEIKTVLLSQTALHDASDDLPPEFSTAAATETDQVQRLLGRITHLGAIPEPIQELVTQLSHNVPMQRAELLMLELKRQIQLHLEQDQQQRVQQASALILRHTLQELGYQVEEFSDTLFVEGGIVHFRRHDWGNYLVRMRINEKTHTANFNVIRAVQGEQNAVSVLDHLAEDRWCAEFPTLKKAMEARGLGLEVTRRLEAGEVPVQQVQADQLPRFDNSEPERSIAPLQARTLS